MAVKVNNFSCIDLPGEKWTERYCQRRNANATSNEKQKRKRVRRTCWGAFWGGGECNGIGKHRARTEQAVGRWAPATSQAPCESGTAASAAPHAGWEATPTHQPADSSAKDVLISFFLFSFYLHIVCANIQILRPIAGREGQSQMLSTQLDEAHGNLCWPCC